MVTPFGLAESFFGPGFRFGKIPEKEGFLSGPPASQIRKKEKIQAEEGDRQANRNEEPRRERAEAGQDAPQKTFLGNRFEIYRGRSRQEDEKSDHGKDKALSSSASGFHDA